MFINVTDIHLPVNQIDIHHRLNQLLMLVSGLIEFNFNDQPIKRYYIIKFRQYVRSI